MSAPSPRVTVFLTGQSALGAISDFADLLADMGTTTEHVSHTRLAGCLSLGVVLKLTSSAQASDVKQAVFDFAASRSLSVNWEEESAPPIRANACGVCVTALGELSGGRALALVARLLNSRGLSVDEIRSLGSNAQSAGLSGIELVGRRREPIGRQDFEDLRVALLSIGPQCNVDLAVQRDDFYRRSKRLLCMDVDSTFVRGEFIDELADLVGVKSEVAEITARAMRGELDFPEALRERVRLLAGLPMSRARELCDRFELTPGADDLVKTVQQLGMKVGLVSGGFDFFVEMLKDRFKLDFGFANELEVIDGRLTGEVTGTIVDGARKAQVLKDMSHVFGVHIAQTIAVGDGANDIDMLKTAGLGIAYQAKPRLQEVAHARLNHHDRLDTLLYLMGFDAPEVVHACRGPELP